jgi:hypothetical protein
VAAALNASRTASTSGLRPRVPHVVQGEIAKMVQRPTTCRSSGSIFALPQAPEPHAGRRMCVVRHVVARRPPSIRFSAGKTIAGARVSALEEVRASEEVRAVAGCEAERTSRTRQELR